MPDNADKFYSDILTADRLRLAMMAAPGVFLRLLGDCFVTCHYGFGTEIHPDLQYVPMSVGTRWIDRFITDSLRRGIVVPGHSDFLFTTPGDRLEVLFCHESDIHVNGKEDDLIAQFIAAQPFSDLHFRSGAQPEIAT